MSSPFGREVLRVLGGGIRHSFTAKSWHAQLSKLTETPAGYAALEAAGLNVTPKTLVAWLSDPLYPVRRGYREQIQSAYDIRRGVWNPENERREYHIHGVFKMGDDVRYRGDSENVAFYVDGRDAVWDRIREEYEAGTLTPERAEELFVSDVIIEATDGVSETLELPGASYTIT